MAHRELRRSVLLTILLATVILAAIRYAYGSAPPASSSSEHQQIGKILSVRKVLQNHYFVGRYPQIHYYLLYFAVRTSDQTYCAEYETAVIDEIDDLFSAKDKDVKIVLKGKTLTLRTPKGWEFKVIIMFGSFLPGLGWLAPKSTRASEPTWLWNQFHSLTAVEQPFRHPSI